MKLLDRINRINRLHKLIQSKSTGSPKDLANRFNCSERCIYRLIGDLRSLNLEISYCRSRRSYVYISQTEFAVSIILNDREINSLFGGQVRAMTHFNLSRECDFMLGEIIY